MHPSNVTRPMSRRLTMLACGLVLSLPACGSGTTPRSGTITTPSPSSASAVPTPTPNATLCANAGALRASLDKLVTVTITPGLANELKTDLNEVKASLSTFVSNARGQWQAQTTAIRSALANMETAANNLAASPGTETVSAAQRARAEVRAEVQKLQAALSRDCPTASPSSSG